MTKAPAPEITKAVVDRFLASKNVTGCSVCGRFQSRFDFDLHTIRCKHGSSTDGEIDVVAIVCENCGALQFLKRSVVADWQERQHIWWAKAACDAGTGTTSYLRTDRPYDRSVAALASVFLFVLIASLLLHRYGGAELWLRPTISTIEGEAEGAAKMHSPAMYPLAFEP
jgi:hypothetical protein